MAPKSWPLGAQPEDVGGDAGELRHDHPDVLGPFGHLDAQELFHRQAVPEIVRLTGQVVDPVHEGQALVVGAGFAHLLDAPMEVADVRVGPEDEFAVQFHFYPEDAVGAGVLRPHVQDHGFGLGYGFSCFHGNFRLSFYRFLVKAWLGCRAITCPGWGIPSAKDTLTRTRGGESVSGWDGL